MMPRMLLSDIFSRQSKSLSFEFFPPKTAKGDQALDAAISELATLKPDFISVTYGAGGSTRERTAEIVTDIQNRHQLPAMAHLTCVNASTTEIAELLDDYYQRGIRNILGLRGDAPEGQQQFTATTDGYAYASELLAAIQRDGRFSTACAAYPDGHPESPSIEADWERLNDKFDAGALVGITQCFFNGEAYTRMLNHCQKRHPQARIIPGIIPVTNFKQIDSFCQRCGAIIPDSMRQLFEPVADDEKRCTEVGMEFTLQLCRDLLQRGAPGLHIYTLNKAQHTRRIVEQMRAEGLL